MKFFTYFFTAFLMLLGAGFAMGAAVPNQRRDLADVAKDVLAIVEDILKIVEDSITLITDISKAGKPSSTAMQTDAADSTFADLTTYLANIGATVVDVTQTTSDLSAVSPGSVNGSSIAALLSGIEGELVPLAGTLAAIIPGGLGKTNPLFAKLNQTIDTAIASY